jgi:hypothetical protein
MGIVDAENNRSPANERVTSTEARSRIPMSLPVQKLAVPEIPGFHLHWMRGDAARIMQAQRAGYSFVTQDEVELANTGIANDTDNSGNTDMGTRVSIVSGGDVDSGGQPERLYLMKLREEFWEEDQKVLADRNESIAQTLRGGKNPGQDAPDGAYIPNAHRHAVENLFTRKN